MPHILPDPQRSGAFRLPDGRRLAWHEWGPRDGAPVRFMPGAGTSGRLGFALEHLDELEVRLIGIDRPGLGGSDPAPGKTLDSVAGDIGAFIAAEFTSSVRAVGYSQGAPFVLALAAQGHVTALTLVAGQDDFANKNTRALLPDFVAEMCERIETEPESVAREVAQADPDWLRNFIIETSHRDAAALYSAEPFASAFAAALQTCFAQGSAGYVRDLLIAAGRWPFAAEDITIPVDLWYGLDDASPVHSPDFGETLSRRFPRASLHQIEGEGGRILWTRGADILRLLVNR